MATDAKEEDVVEGEEEANVEEVNTDTLMTAEKSKNLDENENEDEEETGLLKPNPDVDTYFLFTKPSGMGLGKL